MCIRDSDSGVAYRSNWPSPPDHGLVTSFAPARDGAQEDTFGQGHSFSLSPDGELLFIGQRDHATLLSTKSGNEQKRILTTFGDAYFSEMVWSPDGLRAAVSTVAGYALILETTHYRAVQQLPQHGARGSINRILWSPDGTRVVTAALDRTVRIHDTLHPIARTKRVERREMVVRAERMRLAALTNEGRTSSEAAEELVKTASDVMIARRACLQAWAQAAPSDPPQIR